MRQIRNFVMDDGSWPLYYGPAFSSSHWPVGHTAHDIDDINCIDNLRRPQRAIYWLLEPVHANELNRPDQNQDKVRAMQFWYMSVTVVSVLIRYIQSQETEDLGVRIYKG